MRTLVFIGAFLVFAGAPSSLWFQWQEPPRAMPWSVIGAGWAVGAFALLVVARSSGVADRWTLKWLPRCPTGIVPPILVGVLLRLVVACTVRAVPADDGEVYLALARHLVAQREYGEPGLRAFWPPGLPFFLAPLVGAFGPGLPTLILYGLLTFVLAALGIHRLGATIGLRRHAARPVWLLALWPSLVLCTGLPEKELLLVALLPWILWCATTMRRGPAATVLLGGVLLGIAILCQPAFLLLPLLPFAFLPWARGARLRWTGRCLLVVGGVLLAVVPWVARNHEVLDGALVITTNGGGTLLGANNDRATGGYHTRGQFDIEALDEVARDRRGRQLAVAWIVDHPAHFVRLTAGRTLLFAGDDSYGAFAALRRGRTTSDGGVIPYEAVKLFTMVPWLVLWAIAANAVGRRGFLRESSDAMALVVFVPYAYLSVIHAIFESNGKYHLAAVGCLFVGVVWLLRRPTDESDVTSRDASRVAA